MSEHFHFRSCRAPSCPLNATDWRCSASNLNSKQCGEAIVERKDSPRTEGSRNTTRKHLQLLSSERTRRKKNKFFGGKTTQVIVSVRHSRIDTFKFQISSSKS